MLQLSQNASPLERFVNWLNHFWVNEPPELLSGVVPETPVGREAVFPTRPLSLEDEATVNLAILPGNSGGVWFRGSWWSARCPQNITLNPNEIVYVIGRTHNTLLVQPRYLNQ